MKKTSLLIIAILAVAFIIRFYNIDQKSVWGDEYLYFVTTQLSCQHPLFITSPYESLTWFHDHPYLSLYLFELSCFFPNIETLRFINIIFTLLTIFITYKLASKMFSEKVGLLSAFLLSISFASIAFGRIGIIDPAATFFLVLACYMFYRNKEKLSWFIAGMSFAAKFFSGILIPLFIITYYLKRSFSIKRILIMLSIFLIAFVIFTIGSFISWDYLSASKNLHYKVPVIVKTVLFEIFFRPTNTTHTKNFFTVLNIISDQITLPIFIISLVLPSIIIQRIIFKHKKYHDFIITKRDELIFLFVWLVLGVAVLFVFPSPHISLVVLVPTFILAALTVFKSIEINKLAFVVVLLVLFFYLSLSINDIISSNVYFRPYKSQYSYQFFSFAQEAANYVNENSNSQDKIYLKSLGDVKNVYELKELPNVNENIKIWRNVTEKLQDADYVLVSSSYSLNSNETAWISKNLKLEKTFGSNSSLYLFIYKKII